MSIESTLSRARRRLRRDVGDDPAQIRRSAPAAGAPPEDQPAPRRWRRAAAWTVGTLAALVGLVVLFLLLVDWNALRGPIGRFASARIHRPVVLAGDLEVHPWSWRPRATVEDLRIGQPGWAGAGSMVQIQRLTVQVRLLPLLGGDLDLVQVRAERPDVRLLRDAKGRANWDFSDGRKAERPLRLPPIRRFQIDDGRLRFNDVRRGLDFAGAISAREALGAADAGFRLTGQGTLNRAAFSLRVAGGPLINIDRHRPYPFTADVRAGATRVQARGNVPEPFDLGLVRMTVTASGFDLGDLYGLTGAPLPNTPPYRLKAEFTRDQRLYRFDRLSGRVGDSDLSGDVRIDAAGARPLLTARLLSRSLDFDDMATLFGAAPKIGPGETASPEQAVVARRMIAQQRLFPDAPLNVQRLRAMDAAVSYRAAAIRDAPLPLRSGAVQIRLQQGLLTASDLALDLPRGRVSGTVRLNARGATPVTDLDLRLTNARLEQLLPQQGGEPPLTGTLVARVKLTGAGASVHRAAAASNGQVVIAAPGGEVRRAFAHLMGVNVVKGLGLLLAKDQTTTPVRCAVADFTVRQGVLRADHLVFDTGPVLGLGSGSVDLGAERIDLRLKGHPKKAQLLRVIAPVTVTGPLASPKMGVETDKALAQGGLAAALGALATPLAAILPFLDPGLAKDAACGAMLAEARREGAPAMARPG